MTQPPSDHRAQPRSVQGMERLLRAFAADKPARHQQERRHAAPAADPTGDAAAPAAKRGPSLWFAPLPRISGPAVPLSAAFAVALMAHAGGLLVMAGSETVAVRHGTPSTSGPSAEIAGLAVPMSTDQPIAAPAPLRPVAPPIEIAALGPVDSTLTGTTALAAAVTAPATADAVAEGPSSLLPRQRPEDLDTTATRGPAPITRRVATRRSTRQTAPALGQIGRFIRDLPRSSQPDPDPSSTVVERFRGNDR